MSTAGKFFIDLAKAQAVLSRRFNSGLGGLGFTEFVLMWHLGQATESKLRRVDLAEKVGLTASGVTRLLAPMEKIGLVKREENNRDARVSGVVLTAAGKRQLTESIDELDRMGDDLLRVSDQKNLEKLSHLLQEIALRAR